MVRFEYKHYAFLGQESVWAAEASECANEQDMFWPYLLTLFSNQRGENIGTFSKSRLNDLAAAMGLDGEAFDECLDDGRYSSEVQADNLEAQEREVTSTPVFFINGEMIRGAIPFEEFQSLIQAELAQQ